MSGKSWRREADGVFRGGGVKGIALAGALKGFAEHGKWPVERWVNVAGASAGAIIAGYLAVGNSAAEMVDLLERTKFGSFADFPGGTPALGLVNLFGKHGMARGSAFEQWFDKQLDEAVFGDLKSEPEADGSQDWRLKMVAVDVTNRRLLELPGDLAPYSKPRGGRIDPDALSVARAARMSMSIPYFFEPIELVGPDGGTAVIIDGGTLSNFPVWIFDVDPATAGRPPKRPTFGFTLEGGRGVGAGLSFAAKLAPWPLRFGFDIFHTAQDAWDERFVSHSTRVRTLAVDAADVATTDFELGDEKKAELLANGVSAATKFLDKFDPAKAPNTYNATAVA